MRVRLDRIEVLRIQQMAEDRRKVPVARVEMVDSWTSVDGDLIEMFHHVRDYPPELVFPPIVPGQTTEMRGWRCPGCDSTNTSSWGVTTCPDSSSFVCNACGASAEFSAYCPLPGGIHPGGRCDCDPVYPWEE